MSIAVRSPKRKAGQKEAGTSITRTTDAKGRITLPRSFANATVVIDQVSDLEVRIRKAQVLLLHEVGDPENAIPPLSKRDQELLARMIMRPPRANAALKRLLHMRDDRRD